MVVKGNTDIVDRPRHARTAGQGLLHLRLRARSTSKVRISPNGSKVGGGSSEVVLRERPQFPCGTVAVPGLRCGVITAP